jgi:hypothetical protein
LEVEVKKHFGNERSKALPNRNKYNAAFLLHINPTSIPHLFKFQRRQRKKPLSRFRTIREMLSVLLEVFHFHPTSTDIHTPNLVQFDCFLLADIFPPFLPHVFHNMVYQVDIYPVPCPAVSAEPITTY